MWIFIILKTLLILLIKTKSTTATYFATQHAIEVKQNPVQEYINIIFNFTKTPLIPQDLSTLLKVPANAGEYDKVITNFINQLIYLNSSFQELNNQNFDSYPVETLNFGPCQQTINPNVFVAHFHELLKTQLQILPKLSATDTMFFFLTLISQAKLC